MECVTFKLVKFDMKMEGVKSNLVILQCDKKDLPYFLSRQLVLFLQLVLRVPFNDKIKCEQKSRNSWGKKTTLKTNLTRSYAGEGASGTTLAKLVQSFSVLASLSITTIFVFFFIRDLLFWGFLQFKRFQTYSRLLFNCITNHNLCCANGKWYHCV